MRSVKSSVKGWKTAGTGVAVLIVLQALGLGAAWPQEPAPPRIDEEIAKQEKIYRSRGADVPSGYVTGRGLSDYAELLPTGFCDALGRLGSSDRWLDIGAGDGQAILDYYALEDDAAPAEKCARSFDQGTRGRDVHRGSPNGQVATAGRDLRRRPSALSLRQASAGLFARGAGKISDHYRRVRRLLLYGRLVPVPGEGVELAGDRRRLLHDGARRAFRGWQGQTRRLVSDRAAGCSQPRRESVLLAEENHLRESRLRVEERLEKAHRADKIEKVCSDVSVPRMKLLKYEAGNPPGRRFQLLEP